MNRWQHIAVVFDPGDVDGDDDVGEVMFYKNGVERTSNTNIGYDDSTNNVMIGYSPWDDPYFDRFNGIIDEVAIFDAPLTTAAISAIYNGQKPNDPAFTSRIIDGTATTNWTTLAWTPQRPLYKQLPDNGATGAAETIYTTGNIDMTGNILLLHFNEAVGATTFSDTSGDGVTVSCTNCPTAGASGKFSSAVDFTSDVITTNLNISQAAGSDGITMMAWAYPTSLVADGGGGAVISTTNSGGYDWAFTNANDAWTVWTGNGSTWAPVSMDYGNWQHIAIVFNPGAPTKLYKNGVVYTDTDNSGTDNDTHTVSIGVDADGVSFIGRIDELAIFERQLSATEIEDIYRRGATRLKFHVRSCNDDACDGEDFMGPGPSAANYYSEVLNDTTSLPSIALSDVDVPNNRYFQYKAFLEYDTGAYYDSSTSSYVGIDAELKSVEIRPEHFPQTATVVNNTGKAYTTLSGFSEALGGGNEGSIEYQISNDGANWYYHNGTTWASASSSANINTDDEINSNVATFDDVVGSGSLFFKAFLNSGGEDEVELDTLTITIDDGVTITESGGSTTATEGGATDTYTVALKSQPASNVTVSIATDADTSVDSESLTFTVDNWNTPQTVTVTAVDDDIAEGNHQSTITHTATSEDANYNGKSSNVIVDITDNDSAGVSVESSGGSTSVTEGGATDTYTIVLTTQPTNDVTIDIWPDNDVVSVSPTSWTFTADNWNTAKTLTITAIDDSLAEGSHQSTITHSAGSLDENYAGIEINPVIVDITDNDSAGVTVTASGESTVVTEDGSTDTYTVVLTSQPDSDVTVTITAATDQVSVSPAVLTFTSGDWDTPQTVTVTAVNDDVVEGSHISTITHAAASTDENYSGITILDLTASITDDDLAGITIVETDGATRVTEGSGVSDYYTAVLTSEPTSSVTISVSADGQLTLSPSSLVFTSSNWDTVQTVTVTATNDLDVEGDHSSTITHAVTSSDANFSAVIISSVIVGITDNDTATVEAPEEEGGEEVGVEDIEGTSTEEATTTVIISEGTDGFIGTSAGCALKIKK